MTCASTGWRVEARARVMKLASRSLSLSFVLLFIKECRDRTRAARGWSPAGARRRVPFFVTALEHTERSRAWQAAAAEGSGRRAETAKGFGTLGSAETLCRCQKIVGSFSC